MGKALTAEAAWSTHTELLSHPTLLADTKIGFSSSCCERGQKKRVYICRNDQQITNYSLNIFRIISSGYDRLKQQLLFDILKINKSETNM